MRIISECSKEFDSIVISEDELFKHPPPKEECPICFLPTPYAAGAFGVMKIYQSCCGKMVYRMYGSRTGYGCSTGGNEQGKYKKMLPIL